MVGLNALGLKDIIPDGMNEKGLAGGLLYFAGYADFQKVPAGQTKRSINSSQLLTYVLTKSPGDGRELRQLERHATGGDVDQRSEAATHQLPVAACMGCITSRPMTIPTYAV